jgi:hypothetical protein
LPRDRPSSQKTRAPGRFFWSRLRRAIRKATSCMACRPPRDPAAGLRPRAVHRRRSTRNPPSLSRPSSSREGASSLQGRGSTVPAAGQGSCPSRMPSPSVSGRRGFVPSSFSVMSGNLSPSSSAKTLSISTSAADVVPLVWTTSPSAFTWRTVRLPCSLPPVTRIPPQCWAEGIVHQRGCVWLT